VSLLDGLKRKLVAHEVASNRSDAMSGKLGDTAKAIWGFMDGKKTIIMAILLAWEAYARAHGGAGFFGYVDAITHAIGWDQVTPAVNPSDLAEWAALSLALGHKLVKSAKAQDSEAK
jgi:hypothetical protein